MSFLSGKPWGHISGPREGAGFSWKQTLRNQQVSGDREGCKLREGQEGQPQTVLPASLRRALHCQEPRADTFPCRQDKLPYLASSVLPGVVRGKERNGSQGLRYYSVTIDLTESCTFASWGHVPTPRIKELSLDRR